MRSRITPRRSLASSYDPTANISPLQAPTPRRSGPEQRMPPSPYDRVLVPAAAAWLRALPGAVVPQETAAAFPRIINRIARYWDSAPMLESIFDELLVDRRGGRRGFAPKVLVELRQLYAFYRHKHVPDAARPEAEQRKPPSLYERTLHPAAHRWMRALPRDVVPNEAALRYPRIINRIVRYWNTPAVIDEIFLDLLKGKRDDRSGFPTKVRAEFLALKDFYEGNPQARLMDPWDSVPDRDRGGLR